MDRKILYSHFGLRTTGVEGLVPLKLLLRIRVFVTVDAPILHRVQI